MATSDLARRLGEYAGSVRNIAGCAAGLVALGATVPTHVAGPLWPVVVAGAYGAVALLVPDRKPTFVPDGYTSSRMRAQDLAPLLADLDEKVRRYDRRLPDDAVAAYGRVSGLLHDVLGRADDLATSPDDLFVVGRTITDYLPSSLQTYTALPRDFAMGHRVAGRRTAHEELLAQLALLEKRLGRIATALYEGDAAELAAQGRFLDEKFRGSSLDVGPEVGSGVGAEFGSEVAAGDGTDGGTRRGSGAESGSGSGSGAGSGSGSESGAASDGAASDGAPGPLDPPGGSGRPPGRAAG